MYLAAEYLASLDLLVIFGVAAGVLSTFAFIPYILDTICQRTRPQRASWLIWSVLGSIAFASQVYEGATSSLWFAAVQVSGTIIVFLLSIRGGEGQFLSKTDWQILVAAGVGLILWSVTDNAVYALAITISISLLGGVATIVKAYHDPTSETLITWVVSLIASACAIVSVGSADLVLLAYPIYLFVLYLAFIVAITLGRARIESAHRVPTRTIRPLPFATFFSGLRITADVVIVTAAFIFAFNWVGANSSAFDRSSIASAVNTSASTTGNYAIENYATGNYEAERALAPDSSTRIVAAEADQFVLAPLLTEDSVAKHNAITQAVEVPAAVSLGRRFSAKGSSERGSSATGSSAKGSLESIQQPSYQSTKGFLVLDADDPFAELVVTSTDARLAPINSLAKRNNQLKYGVRLRVLATNGKWFKVRTPDGTRGYIHHSKVEVEALSALSRNRAG